VPPPPRPAAPAAAPLRPEDEAKVLYVVGFVLGRETGVFGLTPAEAEQVTKGFADSVAGANPQFALETYGPQIRPLAQARQARRAEVEKEKGRAFVDQAAREPGAVRAASGLVFVEKVKGSGPTPRPTDQVKVNYHGALVDGKVFDSTEGRGPAEFALNGVIPCWTEGLQKVAVGGKARLVCPSSIAYGDAGRPGIPGGATLVFDVELLGVTPPAAAAPAAPAAPRPASSPARRASPKAAPARPPAKPSPSPQ
jgi:FKBP-type peptidyl-prolyl cis-trans isomerase FkpA